MLRLITAALVLALFASCGSAPAPTRAKAEPFAVISEQADADSGSVFVSITVAPPASPQDVRSAAEAVIAERKGLYRNITVESYAEGTGVNKPLAVSKFEGGRVQHVFNSAPAESQRIPTH
jgi:hypothetical protein